MMNLSRKRSASPFEEPAEGISTGASTGASTSTLTSSGSSSGMNPMHYQGNVLGHGQHHESHGHQQQMNYDQLSALHYAKRLRLAQAQLNNMQAQHGNPLFRPSNMMDLYNTMNYSGASMNMNMNPVSLGFPHHRLTPFMNSHSHSGMSPLVNMGNNNWGSNRASNLGAMNPTQADMSGLPDLPPAMASMSPAADPNNVLQGQAHHEGDEASASGNSTSSLEQLSTFASHMPNMPLINNKSKKPTKSSSSKSNKISSKKMNKGAGSMVMGGHAMNMLQQHQTYCAPLITSVSGPGPKTAKIPTPDPNGQPLPWQERDHVPLAIDEDVNWLSEFQCFLRSDILEVFVASPVTAATSATTLGNNANANLSKKIAPNQIGIRCRFCAHLPAQERASRSSAFPSSAHQIYQSFTMMLREHLNGQCRAMPPQVQAQFVQLKGQSSQSASDSKRYWIYAAHKMGMRDTPHEGIQMTASDTPISLAVTSPTTTRAFGSDSRDLVDDLLTHKATVLTTDQDKPSSMSSGGSGEEFLLWSQAVVAQAQLVHLAASEKIGNRSCLTVGLPGLACKYCCAQHRSGLARVFPARKRNLKTKVNDLYDHLRRCHLVPLETRKQLVQLHQRHHQRKQAQGSDKMNKAFYTKLWKRMGHDGGNGAVPVSKAALIAAADMESCQSRALLEP